MVDSLLSDFGNVYHSFFARCKFDECAEFFDAYNITFKNHSCLEVCYDGSDHLSCLFHAVCIYATDRYASFICDINLNACLFDDCVDGLSSLTYNFTDLSRINIHLNDLRCILANLCSWLSDCLSHNFIQNVNSCFSCTCNCFFDDRSCQSVDLNIHLDRCDTFMCTCYLEVHISEEIFQPLNICKYQIIIVSSTCYQTT